MKRSRVLALSVILASLTMASASPLTPQQALNSVYSGSAASSGKRQIQKRPMQLALTVQGKTAPTVYVFVPQSANATGFLVVSADDCATPLLGYSDDAVFDSDNIPPQMWWWLQAAGATVQDLSDNPAKNAGSTFCNKQLLQSNGRINAKAYAPKSAIAPLCSTKWSQDRPYYNDCPMIDGVRAVTGCVATAMAQTMMVHRWPERGAGQNTYTFECNNKTYTESLDFENTAFLWDDMLYNYNRSYTQANASAVATLMHACGVAANMGYSPEGSGAYENNAAIGLIDYLRYDEGLSVQQRDWYTADDWSDLIYNEIKEGRPVIYCGNNGKDGHAFVCDGYDGSDYFHINWGWGGMSDGYFLLSNLDPDSQGIGGSTSSEGFNYGQTAMTGVKPAQAGSVRPTIIACSNLYADEPTYDISDYSYIDICSDAGFINFSTCTLENINIGLGLVNDDESIFVNYANIPEWPMYAGFTSFSIPTTILPKGTWKAYPALSYDKKTWTPFKYNAALSDGYFNITVTDTEVTVSVAGSANEDPEEAEVKITIEGITPDDADLYRGETYSIEYSFESDKAFAQDYYLIMINTTTWSVAETGDCKKVSTDAPGIVKESFEITIPADLNLYDEYALALCTADNQQYNIQNYIDITVKDKNQAATVGFELIKSIPDDECYYLGTTYDCEIKVTADGAFSDSYCLVLVDYDEMAAVSVSDKYDISMDAAGDMSVSMKIDIPEELDLNHTYLLAICTEGDGSFYIQEWWAIEVAEQKNQGIHSVSADPGKIEYYDLFGRRIETPIPGTFYIEKTGDKSRKIILR